STREPVKSKENGISAALAEISGIDRFSDTRAVVSKKAETARKVKHHTVKIPLSKAGSISEGSKFRNMTPDKTRFLVKQRERFLADNNVD
ncbi:hypothetical protein MAR_037251, partial [Mya arenaria]